jgi:hypothetical protein
MLSTKLIKGDMHNYQVLVNSSKSLYNMPWLDRIITPFVKDY